MHDKPRHDMIVDGYGGMRPLATQLVNVWMAIPPTTNRCRLLNELYDSVDVVITVSLLESG